MQAFTDLVGTAIVPAHCFDSTELTDLTPALDTATAEPLLTRATFPAPCGTPAHCFDSTELTDLTPTLDTATAVHDMAVQANEAREPVTYWVQGRCAY